MQAFSAILSARDRATLREVARRSIVHGLRHQRALAIAAGDYPGSLQALRASFVTLHRQSRLRGCIGALEATLPLVEDVALHAYAAAFEDPRFAPLTEAEQGDLEVHLSVLSPAEALTVSSEAALLAQLRPGRDGLILRFENRRATFLPSVWDGLPTPGEFVAQLKQKAGLARDFWSDAIEVERYTCETF